MSELEKELGELFDMKKIRLREEKIQTEEYLLAKKDITLITLMFSDGIPDLEMPLGDYETLTWDSRSKKLLYSKGDQVQFLDGVNRDNLLKIRPHLKDLAKKAKEFFTDQ